MTIIEIREKLKGHKAELLKFKVKELHVFGSVARGQSVTGSDIDLLIEFTEPVSGFEFLEFRYFLEEILSNKIDLATKDALHPGMKDSILRELVRVA